MPKIYRIRYIPNETVDISSDTLLFRDDHLLITEWKPIHPRHDIAQGTSCVFFDAGYKVSQFMDPSGNLLYWYIDLIDIEYEKEMDTYRLKDLLADVKIYPDGRLEIVDLDELADALEQQLIFPEQGIKCLRILHRLLAEIQSGVQPGLAGQKIAEAVATKQRM